MKSTVVTPPTKAQVETIIRWLKKECFEEDYGGGFYHHRSMIRESFRDAELMCLIQDRKVLGFSTFRLGGDYSAIDLFEIRPGYRRSGYGKLLAQHLIQMLVATGTPRIILETSPRASGLFWRELGFVDQDPKDGSGQNTRLILRSSYNHPLALGAIEVQNQ